MPKPKSEKTLAKEAQYKIDVSKYYEKYVNDFNGKVIRPAIKFTLKAGKVKGINETASMLVRRAVLPATVTARLKEVQYRVGGRFIVGLSNFYVGLEQLKIALDFSFSGTVNCGGKEVSTIKGVDPFLTVMQYPFTDYATALTYPDDLGHCLIYMHKASLLARWKLPKLAIPIDPDEYGINYDALKHKRDWNFLAEYITMMKFRKIPQRTICNIVKTISMNLAAVELEHMKKSVDKNVLVEA